MKRSEIAFSLLKLPMDFVSVCVGFLIAYQVRGQTDLIPGIQLPTYPLPPLDEYIPFVLFAAVMYVLVFAVNRMYVLKVTAPLLKEIMRGIGLTGVWLMLLFTYFFLVREYFFSRLVLFYGTVLTIVLFVFGRLCIAWIQRFFLRRGIGTHRILFLGDTKTARELAHHLTSTGKYTVVGMVDEGEPSQVSGLPLLGNMSTCEALVKAQDVDEVIQTKHMVGEKSSMDVVELCRLYHVRFRFVPDLVQAQLTHIEVASEAGIPVIELLPTPLDGWKRVLKRLVDILGAVFGIIVLSPFLMGTALAVWIQLGSWRHILFRQKRLGYQGKPFFIYKFQSMFLGAEKQHEHLLATQSERSGLLKIKEDPRVTPVGKIIRKTSLDELPQLFNVLLGTMSLVGPRPHMPSEIEKVSRHYFRVLTVKPGITGLAQVSGRSSLDFEEEMALDIAYMEQWSLLSDMLILLKTVLKILRREDAS